MQQSKIHLILKMFNQASREVSASLARSITRAGSKQTYYTAQLIVDRELLNDFYRAYAYFRWTDDIIDVSSQSRDERISFVNRQRRLIDNLYNSERCSDLYPEEKIIDDLIHNDRGKNGGLRSFISNMFAIIEFDAYRKGSFISSRELIWYSNLLAQSVTDGLQYFIGNEHSYPMGENRYFAANAAHITHLLRDMIRDIADGFINIPQEYLEKHNINLKDLNSHPIRAWVRNRVERARFLFREGKCYLDSLDVLRCKLMGYWYCVRFESILDTIERDGYSLRKKYNNKFVWLKMVWLGVLITLKHYVNR